MKLEQLQDVGRSFLAYAFNPLGLTDHYFPAFHERMAGERNVKTSCYHESGHALLRYLLKSGFSISSVTIQPPLKYMGTVNGNVTNKNAFNYKNLSISKKEAFLVIKMGGGAAEKILRGKNYKPQGLFADRLDAKKIIRDLYGNISKDRQKQIMLEAEKRATDILLAHKDKLDALALALRTRRTLHTKDIEAILGTQDQYTVDL